MGLAPSDLPSLIDGARAAHEQLETTLSTLTETHVRQPSLLPGWSRGHLLAHLARNADSHVRLLEAARRGELVEQYDGGQEGRAADIELGAIRDAASLVNDVLRASIRLMNLWAALPESIWDRGVGTNLGMQPAWRLVWSRWRELAIHHVDLDLGYEPQDWPRTFVDVMLDEIAGTLPARLPAGCRLTLQATDMNSSANPGDADIGDSGRSQGTLVTATGPGSSLLAWLLGRETVASGLEFTDEQGQPAAAPLLAPWI